MASFNGLQPLKLDFFQQMSFMWIFITFSFEVISYFHWLILKIFWSTYLKIFFALKALLPLKGPLKLHYPFPKTTYFLKGIF